MEFKQSTPYSQEHIESVIDKLRQAWLKVHMKGWVTH
jgi:hypothetical protein